MFQDYFYNGGIEKVILDIKNYIGSEYNIDILSLINMSNEDLISLLSKEYIRFFRRNILGINKYRQFLKKNKNNYDIIHIHCYNAFGLIYAFIAKRYFNKIIVHAHGVSFSRDFFNIKYIINKMIKVIIKSDKYFYIVVIKEANNFCFNNKKTNILPNAVDYSKYGFKNKALQILVGNKNDVSSNSGGASFFLVIDKINALRH